MSTDISFELSEWDRYLWVWTILIPRKQIYSNVYQKKFGWMDKSDSMEHLPDVIAHKGDIAFHGGRLILWTPGVI